MKPFVPHSLPLKSVQWEPLIPLIGKANRALAYYDGVLYGVTNPEVLLSPLTTQEAVLSSKIEGTQATLGEVLRFEAGEEPVEAARGLDIQEILNYRRVMHIAEEELKTRPFSLNLLKDLHSCLLEGVRGRNKARGQFRTTQNWIGRPGSPIEDADYVPPSPGSLMAHLGNWEKYYHSGRPDPLVQLSIIHAQFEMIHPFLDGNGRIGRMLVPLFLFEKKLLSRPMFHISSYLEENRETYIDRLRMLSRRPAGWNGWIEFFLAALHEQARLNAEKTRQIIDLYQRMKQRAIELTHSQYAVPLLDRIFEQPIFQPGHLEGIKGLPSRPMTRTLINKLRDAGILHVMREGSGRRAQILVFSELVDLCEGREASSLLITDRR